MIKAQSPADILERHFELPGKVIADIGCGHGLLTAHLAAGRRIAKETGVATQMGNQGHSGEGLRQTCEWIWDGAIGPIREVHSWAVVKPWTPVKLPPAHTPPVPEGLNWDLWLGPAAYRPYHSVYHPVTWRCWRDFGTAVLGDFACHHLDPASRSTASASSTLAREHIW